MVSFLLRIAIIPYCPRSIGEHGILAAVQPDDGEKERMQVVFLGGAAAIGATCLAVELAGRWIVVDAGIRMGNAVDRLPDLSFLEGKQPVAIFITHAHADHIGALPLVHQAFPTTPIYASRPTMLLMALMLEDALQIMGKRAISDLEVPLYDDQLLHHTLKRLRPLPMQGSLSVPELPEVTLHISYAGHVAGAVMLGFDAPDGSLLISGDVSITPQRTIPSATLPRQRQPDLCILESTYGARLHPNRQQEEQNLVRAVAERIAQGGHVLIPAFALGRAQEVLRILHAAQQRGTVPAFPVWIDGLVRKVCATYPAFPEALNKPMQRLIASGMQPFTSTTIRFVDRPQQREQLLQGPPACIVTSSGMLTGGPSAFYAARLAEDAQASILITGYQDEESPGRKMLALAEGQAGTLEINNTRVAVRCQVAKYALSAHADGSELAALVRSLQPRTIALVHGDNESRSALAARFQDMEVLLPADGQALAVAGQRRARQRQSASSIPVAPGIGGGLPIGRSDLERLWQAVAAPYVQPQMVNVRELALAWYGLDAGEAEEQAIQQVLAQEQTYFVALPDTPDMVRVRPPDTGDTTAAASTSRPAPGLLLLVQINPQQAMAALCVDVTPVDIRAYIAGLQRTRFSQSAVREIVGRWSHEALTDAAAVREALKALNRAARQWRWRHPPHLLVERMEPEQSYTLDELASLAEIASDDLAGRLALALLLVDTPRLFAAQSAAFDATTRPQYKLAATWSEALAGGDGSARPDQTEIRTILQHHLGNPDDLYKCSVNPDTGEVTLSFHFPQVARQRYAAALDAAAQEAGVPIGIAPQPHQGALTSAAYALLPAELSVLKTSLHHPHHALVLRCSGSASPAAIQSAQQAFQQQTGWRLEFELPDSANTNHTAPPRNERQRPALDMNQASNLVRTRLGAESGCYKVSADQARRTLQVRFHFPDTARQRYATELADLSQQTGWQVTVYPEPHQGAMETAVRRVLPSALQPIGAPSLHHSERQVVVRCRGTSDEQAISMAQAAFVEATGWQLVLRGE